MSFQSRFNTRISCITGGLLLALLFVAAPTVYATHPTSEPADFSETNDRLIEVEHDVVTERERVTNLGTEIMGARGTFTATGARLDDIDGTGGRLGTAEGRLDAIDDPTNGDSLQSRLNAIDGAHTPGDLTDGLLTQTVSRLDDAVDLLDDADGNGNNLRQTVDGLEEMDMNLGDRLDDIDGTGGRLGTAEGDIATAQGDIGDVESRLNSIRSTGNNLEQTVGNLEDADDALERADIATTNRLNDIDGIDGDPTNVGRLGRAEGRLDTTDTVLGGALVDADGETFDNIGDRFDATDTVLDGALEDADGRTFMDADGEVDNIGRRFRASEGRLTTNENQISGVRNTLEGALERASGTTYNNVGERFEESETDIGDNLAAIGVNREDIGDNEAAIGVNREDIGDNEAAIGVNREDIGDNLAAIGVNREDIGDNLAAIGVNREDIGDNLAAIGVNREDIGDNLAAIGVNREDIGANEAEIVRLDTRVTNEVDRLDGEIDRLDEGIAMATALSMMEVPSGHKFGLSLGVGHYQDRQAMALGVGFRPKKNLLIRVGGAYGFDSNKAAIGGSISIGF